MRLPSDGEARLIHAALGPPATVRNLWLGDHTAQLNAAVSSMSSTGLTSTGEANKSSVFAYLCVEEPS